MATKDNLLNATSALIDLVQANGRLTRHHIEATLVQSDYQRGAATKGQRAAMLVVDMVACSETLADSLAKIHAAHPNAMEMRIASAARHVVLALWDDK